VISLALYFMSGGADVKRITAQRDDEISSTEESQSSAVRTVALWVGKSLLTMLLLLFFYIFFASSDFIYINLAMVSYRFALQ